MSAAGPSRDGRNSRTAGRLVAVVVGMVALAYAAAPLYDMFCRATGYGGTTQVSSSAPALPRPAMELTPAQLRSRRARNTAIGLAIGALVILFYAVTVVKLGPGILNRPL